MAARRHILELVIVAVVLAASLALPRWAWANYRSPGSETNTFATHVLLAPGRPACSGLGILSVTLTWAAPSDAAYALSYELGNSTTSGGPYGSYVNVGSGTSTSISVASGDHYYVVRSVNHSWRGATSAERDVHGILFLAATCP